MAILKDLTQTAPAATQPARKPLEFRVSEKGGVSVYGLQRWPVTLYESQWRALLAHDNVRELIAFLDANHDRLSQKGD